MKMNEVQPSALAVDGRSLPRTVDELGMRCDAKQIPEAVDGPKPTGYWIAGASVLRGTIPWLQSDAAPITALSGTTAFAVAATTCYAIVSPDDMSAPACWISVPLSVLTVTGSGSQGFLKKRPTGIEISAPSWTLEIREVNQLFRSSNRFQSGQEQSLLVALGG